MTYATISETYRYWPVDRATSCAALPRAGTTPCDILASPRRRQAEIL